MMIQLREPDLEAIRWLGASEDDFSGAWLEYDKPDVMLYILEYLGMPEQQLVRLRISMLYTPLLSGGFAWDLITDKQLLERIIDLREGRIDAYDMSELSHEAGRVSGDAAGKAWKAHEAGRRWAIVRIHEEVPDLQAWIDDKSKENE